MNAPQGLDLVLKEALAYPEKFQSLLLATCDDEKNPEASYAPYVVREDNYYVFLSELARHTGNLLANPRCSVLFLESEADAKLIFARRRLTVQCEVTEVPRGTPKFTEGMQDFRQRFGDFFSNLERMADFHLFRLAPKEASYVTGFAKAYTLSGERLRTIRHRNDVDHRMTEVTGRA